MDPERRVANATDAANATDDELLRRLGELLRQSRRVESDLVEHIAEVDERRLYAREGTPSMFAYCTEVLRLSEAEAYLRIAVARASRKHPALLTLLSEGRLHLSGIAKLAPILTSDNWEELAARAVHKSKREIEELVATIAPRPDVPTSVRRLPVSLVGRLAEHEVAHAGVAEPRTDPAWGGGGQGVEQLGSGPLELRPDGVDSAAASNVRGGRVSSEPSRSSVEALAADRYKVQFTASSALREKLERLRALLRPEIPDGDLAAIIETAVSEKLERIEARRFAAARRPRKSVSQVTVAPASRHIPAPVRREVRARDGLQCGFVAAGGRRCTERARLEYHHRHPFGMGGDLSVSNLTLLCRTHNSWLAEQDYGRSLMARHRVVGETDRDQRAAAMSRERQHFDLVRALARIDSVRTESSGEERGTDNPAGRSQG